MTDPACRAQELDVAQDLDAPARIDALAGRGAFHLRAGRPLEALVELTRAAELYATGLRAGDPAAEQVPTRPAMRNDLATTRAQVGDLSGAAAAAHWSVDHLRRLEGHRAGAARRLLAAALVTLAQALEPTHVSAAADAACEALEYWMELDRAAARPGCTEAGFETGESVVVTARLAARLTAARGSTDRALDHLEAAAPAARRLVARGVRGVEQAGGLFTDAATPALKLDLPAVGLEYATRSVAVLAIEVPATAARRRSAAVALTAQATAADRLGQWELALQAAQRALAVYRDVLLALGPRPPADAHPDDERVRAHLDLATALKNCAVLLARGGHHHDAAVDADAAADLYAALADTSSPSPISTTLSESPCGPPPPRSGRRPPAPGASTARLTALAAQPGRSSLTTSTSAAWRPTRHARPGSTHARPAARSSAGALTTPRSATTPPPESRTLHEQAG